MSVSKGSTRAKNTVSRSKDFGDLPNEVLLDVMSYLQPAENASSEETLRPQADWSNDEYPSFKALRVTNKRLHALATPLLFETLILLYHAESWRALNNIALSPNLAHLVKRIQIANQSILGSHCNLVELVRGLPTWLYPQDCPEGLLERRPAGGPLARLDQYKAARQLRRRYWYRGEGKMEMHYQNNTAPPLALHLFTNLTTVQTVGHRELAIVKMALHDGKAPSKASRREVEASCLDMPRFGCDVEEGHLETFNLAMKRSGWHLENLILRCAAELFDGRGPIDLATLRYLEVRMNEEGMQKHNIKVPPCSASWVHSLGNLEHFAVTGNTRLNIHPWTSSSTVEDIFMMLEVWKQKVRWPRLAKVSLKNTTTHFEPLSNFMMRHTETLRDLNLVNVELSGGSWTELHRLLFEAGCVVKEVIE